MLLKKLLRGCWNGDGLAGLAGEEYCPEGWAGLDEGDLGAEYDLDPRLPKDLPPPTLAQESISRT
ncbi:MAG TPA: hypothetical protein PK587_00685 [Syntrophales bacterium]|nr:hypothetical protein [Syntrophales bacterium]